MKLIVLDRDGVINEDSDAYIKSAEEWVPIPGSLEAIARVYHAGYRVLVASNQSGLGRGLFTIEDLNAMHRKLARELAVLGAQIEAVFFCPHTPEDRCACRKPEPGLLREIAERLQVDLEGVPCVGDALRDIEAAQRAGAAPILVLTGKGRATLERHPTKLTGVPVYDNLLAVAEALTAS
jgi:D-glycero-D-manno-heptose 1,7-bisphosphate phosphatase